MKKIVSLILAAALCLSMSAVLPSASAANLTEITIYKGVNIHYRGEVITPKDESGNEVTPFVYNGTTYLPVRAVAGIFGASVMWNDTTRTVSMTKGAGTISIPYSDRASTGSTAATVSAATDAKIIVDGMSFVPTDAQGNAVPVLIIDGTTYLPARAIATLHNAEVSWDSGSFRANLGKTPTASELKTETQEMVGEIRDIILEYEQFYANILLARESYMTLLAKCQSYATINNPLLTVLAVLAEEISGILEKITATGNLGTPITFKNKLAELESAAEGITKASQLQDLIALRSSMSSKLASATATYVYCSADVVALYTSRVDACRPTVV